MLSTKWQKVSAVWVVPRAFKNKNNYFSLPFYVPSNQVFVQLGFVVCLRRFLYRKYFWFLRFFRALRVLEHSGAFKNINYHFAKKARNENYNFLHNSLSPINTLQINFDTNKSPMVYPLLIEVQKACVLSIAPIVYVVLVQ